jgi:SOS-response transcriptional repressor LexA
MHYFFEENLTRSERVKKQEEEIFNIIKQYITKQHRPPSIREIAKKSKVSSPQTVSIYLKKLKEKGLVDWVPKKAGTLHIVQEKSSAI